MHKEKPILFSGEMVRATLAGNKTETRRVVKPQPAFAEQPRWEIGYGHSGYGWYCGEMEYPDEGAEFYKCPYGIIGDRLWVKETHYRYGEWIKNGKTKTGKQKWKFRPLISDEKEKPIKIFYRENPPAHIKSNKYRKAGWYQRSALFMPRWACRLVLEITEIRVERIQEIGAAAAALEGFYVDGNAQATRDGFREYWNKLNAKRGYSWESNPWVWVVCFKVVEGKEK